MKKIILSLLGIASLIGCGVENINYTAPDMITYEPQNVLTTSASLGGYALFEGGKNISEYGIAYSTGENPTVSDNKVVAGSRKGEFFNSYDIFNPGTTYYYRTYGINEVGVGYGETYSFTTQAPAPCNPAQNNRVDTGIYFNTININNVALDQGFDPIDYGNLEFEATSYSSTIRIFARFNEIDARLPLTGSYKVVSGFEIDTPQSVGEVELYIWNYGSEIGGADAVLDQNIYVENNNGQVSIIFCNTEFNQYYKLNGKFTYTN